MYAGDFRLGETFDVKFTTIQSTGAPITLAGTPAVAAYPGNSTTEITAGITLSVDLDSRTGMHNVRVVASSGNGYATATNYALVLTAGTVDSVSVVGYVIAHFSIENRSALMPTTVARTLDVSAGGEAGIDWANIGSPTTAVNLSATNIDVDQVVASVSGAVGSVTGNVGGNVAGSVASVTAQVTANVTAISGDTTAADNLEAALDGTGGVTITAGLTGNVTGNLSGSVGSVTGAVGSVTGNVGGNVAGSVGSVTAAVEVSSIQANVVNASALAADAGTEIAAAVLAAATANPIDANVQEINDVALTGDGSATPWGPA
jgi:hypothetical protein